MKPFKTEHEALGAVLDLIQYKVVLKEFTLSDEEHDVFCAAVIIHDKLSD